MLQREQNKESWPSQPGSQLEPQPDDDEFNIFNCERWQLKLGPIKKCTGEQC